MTPGDFVLQCDQRRIKLDAQKTELMANLEDTHAQWVKGLKEIEERQVDAMYNIQKCEALVGKRQNELADILADVTSSQGRLDGLVAAESERKQAAAEEEVALAKMVGDPSLRRLFPRPSARGAALMPPGRILPAAPGPNDFNGVSEFQPPLAPTPCAFPPPDAVSHTPPVMPPLSPTGVSCPIANTCQSLGHPLAFLPPFGGLSLPPVPSTPIPLAPSLTDCGARHRGIAG